MIGFFLTLFILICGYAGGFYLGSVLLRRILRFVDPEIVTKPFYRAGLDFHDIGLWIGLCEHFMIVTFVIMNEYTAIGLIFAAKSLVRTELIRKNPSYYLLGTLLSVSFAILFGLLTQIALCKLT